jgi:O-antigen ligase
MLVFLLSLFGISTLTSQSAMDVSAILIVIYMLWKGFSWRQQDATYKLFNPTGFDWIFPLWVIVVAAGVSLNAYWYDSTLLRTIEFKWVLFFYILSAAFIYKGFSTKVIWPTMLVVLICSIYAIAVYFMGWDPIHPENDMSPTAGTIRTGGFFGNAMAMAHSYGVLFSLLFGLLLTGFHWKQNYRWPLLLTLFLLGISILLTLTRGVWISLFLSTLVVTFIHSRRIFLSLIVIWGVVFAGLYEFWPSFSERISGYTEVNENNSERVLYWKNNIEMWKDYPILGIGIGENTARAAEYYEKRGFNVQNIMISHAHNQYLNYLTGTGILGLLCYLIFIFSTMRLNFKILNTISYKDDFKRGLALGCIASQTFFIFGGLTESNFEHSKIKYIMTIVWGILIWLAYESRVLRHKA